MNLHGYEDIADGLRNFYLAEQKKRERRRLLKGAALLIAVSIAIAVICLRRLLP